MLRRLWRSWRLSRWTMTRYSKPVLSMLLWFFGGALYFVLEVAYKTATGHPERISWTMLVVAIVLCIPVERCGAAACAALVTAAELVAGLLLNVWLGLGVWDYSDLPFNFMGQICPQFSLVWWALCLMFIPVFDWLRYAVEGKEKPHYTFIARK